MLSMCVCAQAIEGGEKLCCRERERQREREAVLKEERVMAEWQLKWQLSGSFIFIFILHGVMSNFTSAVTIDILLLLDSFYINKKM